MSDLTASLTITQDRSGTFERAASAKNYFGLVIPTGMITLDTDSKWKTHRRIMGPAMTSQYLIKSTGHISESVADLISLWKVKADRAGGRAFDVSKDAENASMDTICGMAFGDSWGCNQLSRKQISSGARMSVGETEEAIFHVERPDLANAMYYLGSSTGYPARQMAAIAHFFIRLTPTYRRHANLLYNEFRRVISQAHQRAAQTDGDKVSVYQAVNTLDLMVGTGAVGNDRLPDNEIRDELLTYLIAGTETTGTALLWWIKLMTRHPELQVKFREYIRGALSEEALTSPGWDDLTPNKTPYLEAMIYETLRYGMIAVFARRVMRDTVVLGQHIPKGTNIIVPTHLGFKEIPDWQPDRPDKEQQPVGHWASGSAQCFDPDRWLDADGFFDPNAGPSLPFGSGVRGCFGKNLALLELRVFILQLNRVFFFASVSEAQNSFKSVESIVRRPTEAVIRPVAWDSEPAKQALQWSPPVM
ncbi:MAG: hypothetical protein TREMPRED_003967 [Tremellales sp. Tagirdzhanova-0007]|nr:MAG: hypothetical protein TREMPRED_003967 [Tremellales sp. Tagirdzhanova-0007]